ncbi:flavin reductase, partial [Streptomyces microflavus]
MTASPELAPSPTASPELLRSVFRRHAAGVAVITATGDRPGGGSAPAGASGGGGPPRWSGGRGPARG